MGSPRMNNARLALVVWAFVAASACSGKGSGVAPGTGGGPSGGSGGAPASSGGATASGGAPGTGGMAGGTGGGGGAAGSGATCALAPPSAQPGGMAVKFPIDLVYDGRPFVFGEENAVSDSRAVIPTEMRFYVSNAELLTAGGGSVPVDILTESGAMAPYGVFLFNADDAGAQTLHVRAPAGAYAGLKFSLGLTVACNRSGAAGKEFPLSADSGMTWPSAFGYLFLRYTSRVSIVADAGTADGGTPARLPNEIHMGSDLRDLARPSALTVRISGAFEVTASGAVARRVGVAMDQVFKGATTEVDLSDYPFATGPIAMVDGERLRRNGESLPLFVFAP